MNIYTQKKTFSSYFISFIGYLYSLLLFFNYPPFSHIHWINSTLPFVLRFNVMHAHIHSPAGSVTFWATWTEIPVHNISNEVVSNSNLENIFTKKTFWTFLLTDETRKAIGIVCVCPCVCVCAFLYCLTSIPECNQFSRLQTTEISKEFFHLAISCATENLFTKSEKNMDKSNENMFSMVLFLLLLLFK